MGEHRFNRAADAVHAAVTVPTVREQQVAKFGYEFSCKDCLHAYRVAGTDGREVLNCYEGPPGMQIVQTVNALRQPVEAMRQVWAIVHPDQFCDQFKRDLNAPKSPLLSGN
jgi:hypothetical protein